MRPKEECNWCMSTQHIIRSTRCSACIELWDETHITCDSCKEVIDLDIKIIHYDKPTDMYICDDCRDKHGYV